MHAILFTSGNKDYSAFENKTDLDSRSCLRPFKGQIQPDVTTVWGRAIKILSYEGQIIEIGNEGVKSIYRN